MKMPSLKEVAHVAAMLGLLGVGLRCGGEGEEESHAHFTTQGGLLVSERSALQVCLEVDEALRGQEKELAARVEEGLAQRRSHPSWKPARYGAAPVKVVLGCPTGERPAGALSAKDSVVGPGLTRRPSPFRTHVHVLSEERAAVVLGEREADRAVAELMRVGDHDVAEVSTALLVRASALTRPSFVERRLPMALGLSPLVEQEVPEAESLPKRAPAPSVKQGR